MRVSASVFFLRRVRYSASLVMVFTLLIFDKILFINAPALFVIAQLACEMRKEVIKAVFLIVTADKKNIYIGVFGIER